MDLKKKITISWSGGKDSALALFRIIQSQDYEIIHLHTVIDEETKRVGLHGVREELIERQAECLGLKLVKLYLPSSQNHEAYQHLLNAFYQDCVKEKIEGVMFGDIFLEDLKTFRETNLHEFGLTGIFPLWKENSNELIVDFIDNGFKTIICAADTRYFNSYHMGQTIDKKFIKTLPPTVDVCGENGEFHTFVYDGPIFKQQVNFYLGEVVVKVYNYKVKNAIGEVDELKSSFLFQELLLREEIVGSLSH